MGRDHTGASSTAGVGGSTSTSSSRNARPDHGLELGDPVVPLLDLGLEVGDLCQYISLEFEEMSG